MTSDTSGVDATQHNITLHFAQPMSPHIRHEHEEGIEDEFFPAVGIDGYVAGGGTELSEHNEPCGSDIDFTITTDDILAMIRQLIEVVESNGAGRGSWVESDGTKHPFGASDFILLRAGVDVDALGDVGEVVRALQAALGDGEIGWHDETYAGHDGVVFVFSGDSGDAIAAALAEEIVKHPGLANATVVPFVPR